MRRHRQVRVEHVRAAEGVGVGLAHEARSDQADVQGGFGHGFSSEIGWSGSGEQGFDELAGAGDGSERRCLGRVLLGLDDDPAGVAGSAHEIGDA